MKNGFRDFLHQPPSLDIVEAWKKLIYSTTIIFHTVAFYDYYVLICFQIQW